MFLIFGAYLIWHGLCLRQEGNDSFEYLKFMDNSVYITLSRQLALFRDMDTTANNIANANTVGYSSEHLMFHSFLTKDMNQGVRNPMTFANDISSYRNTQTGPIGATGNPLDIAIQGHGYFSVETPLGARYTRAGNFQLDSNGFLTTVEGFPVLDNTGQRISFPEDTETIEVGEVGNIKVNGEDFAILGVVTFENEQLLEQTSSGFYKSEVEPLPSETARVLQGALERSNVQPVKELVHMIDVSRGVGSTARFIEIIYDLQRKAANAWTQQG